MNNFYVTDIKLSELANITNMKIQSISRYFKNSGIDEKHIKVINNRIIGVSPNAAEIFLRHFGHDYFFRPSVLLFSNLCGGVGKTSGINNISSFLRRIVSVEHPIFIIDADSQSSLTEQKFGEMADESELTMIDYLDKKATLNDIITDCGNNIFFLKSNFNLSGIDKVLSSAKRNKSAMYNLYMDIFNTYKNAYILQDCAPSLGTMFSSSVCGLYQLDNTIKKSILIPIRSDKTAIGGADKVLNEISDIKDTYSFQSEIPVHCYFANIDKRTTTTFEAIQDAKNKERVLNTLAGPYIRYSAELIKNINQGTNLFGSKRTNHAALDFADLIQYVYKDGESSNAKS